MVATMHHMPGCALITVLILKPIYMPVTIVTYFNSFQCSLTNSFIRLCDYLVVTMLHNLVVASASAVLKVLQDQTKRDTAVDNLIDSIPEDIEEQERILQVLKTVFICTIKLSM